RFLPAGLGAVVEVSTNSKQTGLLLPPDGASRWDLLPLQRCRDYALKHGESWYAFVNGRLGRMIGSGDLYLVTGVIKSTSWSIAAIENESGDGKVSLKLKAAQFGNAGASCAWEWESANSSVNSGPRRRLGEESWRDNQTVFLRGFKVAIRSGFLRRRNALLIVNSKWSDVMPKPTFIPFSQSRPGPSGMNDPPRSSGSAPSTSSASDDDESLDYIPIVPHPSADINEFLLDSVANAVVAVTHDDEWASLLDEADDGVLDNHELIRRISDKFDTHTASGGACLQARNSEASSTFDSPDREFPPASGIIEIQYSDHIPAIDQIAVNVSQNDVPITQSQSPQISMLIPKPP
ncbi:hypothetical protein DFH09DRAFT_1467258, partial [Mycena vulgaris]